MIDSGPIKIILTTLNFFYELFAHSPTKDKNEDVIIYVWDPIITDGKEYKGHASLEIPSRHIYISLSIPKSEDIAHLIKTYGEDKIQNGRREHTHYAILKTLEVDAIEKVYREFERKNNKLIYSRYPGLLGWYYQLTGKIAQNCSSFNDYHLRTGGIQKLVDKGSTVLLITGNLFISLALSRIRDYYKHHHDYNLYNKSFHLRTTLCIVIFLISFFFSKVNHCEFFLKTIAMQTLNCFFNKFEYTRGDNFFYGLLSTDFEKRYSYLSKIFLSCLDKTPLFILVLLSFLKMPAETKLAALNFSKLVNMCISLNKLDQNSGSIKNTPGFSLEIILDGYSSMWTKCMSSYNYDGLFLKNYLIKTKGLFLFSIIEPSIKSISFKAYLQYHRENAFFMEAIKRFSLIKSPLLNTMFIFIGFGLTALIEKTFHFLKNWTDDNIIQPKDIKSLIEGASSLEKKIDELRVTQYDGFFKRCSKTLQTKWIEHRTFFRCLLSLALLIITGLILFVGDEFFKNFLKNLSSLCNVMRGARKIEKTINILPELDSKKIGETISSKFKLS